MIQFNLLPDVKLDYIKTHRAKRTVIVISALVSGVLLAVLILLFLVVNVFQKQHLKDLQHDIDQRSQQLQKTPDLNKILTVQNQLQSLPGLLTQKPVVSRLFTYITQTTPANVTISKYDIDFDGHTFSISGNTDSLETVNKFVDSLKFTTYAPQVQTDQSQAKKAFSNVVLSSFSRDDKGATYQMDLEFDPAIFDASQSVTLTVPKITSTRSETDKPSALFLQPSNSSGR